MRKRTIPFPWIAAACLLLLAGLILCFPGYRFSAMLVIGCACVIVCYELLRYLGNRHPKTAKGLRNMMAIVLCIFLLAAAVTGVIIIQASYGNPDTECDYLIVLGAGVNGTVPSLSLRDRLVATCTYLQQHPDTLCIVSGGQGPGEEITEAACMYQYLVEAGIDPDRIILEQQATSTKENLQFSMALMELSPQTRIGVLSSEYHLFRAKCMARDLGLDPIMIPAKTTRVSLRMNYYFREVAGVWYYTIFGG